jgi:hypothetical protein
MPLHGSAWGASDRTCISLGTGTSVTGCDMRAPVRSLLVRLSPQGLKGGQDLSASLSSAQPVGPRHAAAPGLLVDAVRVDPLARHISPHLAPAEVVVRRQEAPVAQRQQAGSPQIQAPILRQPAERRMTASALRPRSLHGRAALW